MNKKGVFLVTLSALLWGLFPLLTWKNSSSVDPLWNAAISTILSIIPFATLVLIRNKWREFVHLQAVKYSLYSATFLGVLYYSFVFMGSHMTSPQNTAILLLLELVTTVVLLAPMRSERLHLHEIIGALLLLGAAILVIGFDMTSLAEGDWLLIVASFFTPFGNVYAKKARAHISSETYLLIRAIWSSIFLILLANFLDRQLTMEFSRQDIIVLGVSGILLMGLSKIFWTEGFVHLKIASALAIFSGIAPIVTFLGTYLFFGQVPTAAQYIALPISILGAFILLSPSVLQRRPAECSP